MKTRHEAKAAAKATLARESAQVGIEKQRAQIELNSQREAAKIEREKARLTARTERAERARGMRVKRLAERAKRRSQRRQQIAELRARIGQNVAGTAAGVVYLVALASAALGQVQTALELQMPWFVGVAFAAFLEGGAIAAAMTAHAARLNGDRSAMGQLVTVALTMVAAGIQLFGHSDRLLGGVMATATIVAVVVFEMRLSVAVADADKRRGVRPPARFGMKRWIVAPVSTVRAWRMDVLSRATKEAAAALAADRQARTERVRERDRRRAARAYNRAVTKALTTGQALPSMTVRGHRSEDTVEDSDAVDAKDTSVELGDVPELDGQPAWVVSDSVPAEWVDEMLPPHEAIAIHLEEAAKDSNEDTGEDSEGTVEDSDAADVEDTSRTPRQRARSPRATKSRTPSRTGKRSSRARVTDEQIVAAYDTYVRQNGRAPSIRELAKEAGCGKNRASKYLETKK